MKSIPTFDDVSSRSKWRTSVVLLFLFLAACTNPYLSEDTRKTGLLSDDTITLHASAGPIAIENARLITNNDRSFRAKLDIVRNAKTSIDASYYIFHDDFSSAVLIEEMIAAAQRGVVIRLIVDYHTNYSRLDLYSMMESAGTVGEARNLQVRFYNRPTPELIRDAIYLTLGCGSEQSESPGPECSSQKYEEIDALFDGSMVSNVSTPGSGLFLSGLYSKDPQTMALAVLRGQNISVSNMPADGAEISETEISQAKEIGKLYWRSRTAGPFRRLTSAIALSAIFKMYGEKLNPAANMLNGYLPLNRPVSDAAGRDWEYLTDFTHHKILLADRKHMLIGGRNVEDSYHMQPNEMLDKYAFMDTDLDADLRNGGEQVEEAFSTLWNFGQMVATLDEVRMHAPNNFVANIEARKAADEGCVEKPEGALRDRCTETAFSEKALDRLQREENWHNAITRNAASYRTDYQYSGDSEYQTDFALDPESTLWYVENLPFYGSPEDAQTTRSYGTKTGQEAQYGKRIHGLWLAGIRNTCASATAENPRRIIIHNAYFFPPANLMVALADIVDGTISCKNVSVTVLTNSIETTDLNVVNLLARHSTKAFAEYVAENRSSAEGASFEYFEYQLSGQDRISLHSKVSVLGSDMIVGSANADVRSYVMDTNNGFYIRRAPEMLERYTAHLDALMEDETVTKEVTDYFIKTDRSEILKTDRETFREIMSKYRAERFLDADQAKQAEEDFVETLNEAYRLSKKSLTGDRKAQEEFDRTFKPI
jgi:putative cardiolipin synthase